MKSTPWLRRLAPTAALAGALLAPDAARAQEDAPAPPPPPPDAPAADRTADEVTAQELLEALAAIAEQQATAAEKAGAPEDAARWKGEAGRLCEAAKALEGNPMTAIEFARKQEETARTVGERARDAGDAVIAERAKAAIAFWSDLRAQFEQARSSGGPVAIRIRVPRPPAGASAPGEGERAPGVTELPAGAPKEGPGAPGAAPPKGDGKAIRDLLARAKEGDEAAREELAKRVSQLAARAKVLGIDAPADDLIASAEEARAHRGAPGAPAPRLESERAALAGVYRAHAQRAMAQAAAHERQGERETAKAEVAEAAAAIEMAEFLSGR